MSVLALTVPGAVCAQLRCEKCGAETAASCGCGVAYVPAGERAAAAIAADPTKSDRAIAAEIGVDHKTVSKARRASTGEHSPAAHAAASAPVEPVKRIGIDGKQTQHLAAVMVTSLG